MLSLMAGVKRMTNMESTKNFVLKAASGIKPYGDTMNDGQVRLSFSLPVPMGQAREAAAGLPEGWA